MTSPNDDTRTGTDREHRLRLATELLEIYGELLRRAQRVGDRRYRFWSLSFTEIGDAFDNGHVRKSSGWAGGQVSR